MPRLSAVEYAKEIKEQLMLRAPELLSGAFPLEGILQERANNIAQWVYLEIMEAENDGRRAALAAINRAERRERAIAP